MKRQKLIVIEDDVYKEIQKIRGKHLIKTGKDLDFSKAANVLLRRGLEVKQVSNKFNLTRVKTDILGTVNRVFIHKKVLEYIVENLPSIPFKVGYISRLIKEYYLDKEKKKLAYNSIRSYGNGYKVYMLDNEIIRETDKGILVKVKNAKEKINYEDDKQFINDVCN